MAETTESTQATESTEATATTETTAHAPTGHEATIDAYVRFWNAASPDEGERLAATAFSDGIRYHALIGTLSGPAELAAFRDEFTREVGPAVFRPRAEAQILSDRARLRWELEAGGRQPFATGTDVLVFGRDGRIDSVSAFLDQAPEGFTPQAHP